MTDPTPSLVDSWKEALVRWKPDAFSTLALPSLPQRQEVLNEWVQNYTFQLMRASLDGVRLDGTHLASAPRDVPATSLDEVHAAAQTALVRLVHHVPASALVATLDRSQRLWDRARDVVRKTLSAPRLARSNAISGVEAAANQPPISLPGFDAAWPQSLPRSLHDVLTNDTLASRLEARRQEAEAASQPSPVRPVVRM